MSEARIEAYKLFKKAIRPLRKYKLSTRYPFSRIYNSLLPYITPTVVKEVEVNGYRMRAKTGEHNTDGVGQLLAFEGEYERTQTELVKSIIKPEMVCIDVGANIGYYTLLLSSLAKNGYVWSIEPELNNLVELKYNIALNNYQNINVLELAVGNDDKMVDFYISGISPGRHSTVTTRYDGGYVTQVRMKRLDDIIPDNEIINFIKSDTEGRDMDVMLGARNIINRNPKIKWLMEIWPDGLHTMNLKIKDVFDAVRLCGFKSAQMVDDNKRDVIMLDMDNPVHLYNYTKHRNGANVLLQK
jgi:FkbM family methyltransferase